MPTARRAPLGHALVAQFGFRAVGLFQRKIYGTQHRRRLGELDIAVGNDLDAIAPWI
jgi:hypothetical protein